jgi:hypothetical protein
LNRNNSSSQRTNHSLTGSVSLGASTRNGVVEPEAQLIRVLLIDDSESDYIITQHLFEEITMHRSTSTGSTATRKD